MVGEDIVELSMLKVRMIVDQYLNKKYQPPIEFTRNWSKDMIAYFKRIELKKQCVE